MRAPTQHRPKSRTEALEPARTIDWLAVWALSLGLCAVVLAGIAFFTIGDKNGASLILAAAATIIGLTLHLSTPPAHE